uniref:Uncharacterized protein n=1 Tax=Spironucleus salmonicida TaxID=348837 RepID=V6LBC3_9EUKA|eukprot:EST41548.1 Hypothetical protein SS50377_18885 [Spironucleus salmonicida]
MHQKCYNGGSQKIGGRGQAEITLTIIKQHDRNIGVGLKCCVRARCEIAAVSSCIRLILIYAIAGSLSVFVLQQFKIPARGQAFLQKRPFAGYRTFWIPNGYEASVLVD